MMVGGENAEFQLMASVSKLNLKVQQGDKNRPAGAHKQLGKINALLFCCSHFLVFRIITNALSYHYRKRLFLLAEFSSSQA